MYKNQTPRQLAFYLSLYAVALFAAVALVMRSTGMIEVPGNVLAAGLLASFVGLYLLNYYFIRHYIFRKIKLIYKIIHRHRVSPDFRAQKLAMGKNVLEDVEREVSEWAEKRGAELKRMEELASYRRRFIGDVSHELKTPIFNIQGFIHTLLDGALDDPKVNVQYLHRAARNAERLQAIVEDLETINKLESGQMVLDLREFDLRDLTDEVFADAEMRARDRNIRLTYKEGAGQNFRVRADKEGMRQVLMNLVLNSIKYGKEGGQTKVSFYDLESYVLVEVSDNGIGIAPEHLQHVFDRFYRIDKSRSRDAGGTGLGLSIVKHIVEAHHQTVTVRSNVGQGSTFGFTVEKVR
jgi:two-component system phosphate regulon sensor histidine kinase PhoR